MDAVGRQLFVTTAGTRQQRDILIGRGQVKDANCLHYTSYNVGSLGLKIRRAAPSADV